MALPKREHLVEVSEKTKRRYLTGLHGQLQDLRQAMERSDFEQVREICHRISGSAGLFGLRDLGEACRATEAACLNGQAEQVVEGFQVIEVIVARNVSPPLEEVSTQ